MNSILRGFRTLCLERPLQRRRGQVTFALFHRLAHRRAINENIKFPYVQVVNVDGRLDPPQPLSLVLSTINRDEFFVQLVTDDQPIVKVLSRKEAYDKAKALKKARKGTGRLQGDKEIQLTWGVAVGDLEHKINKVRKELGKKNRVNLVFTPKKRQPVPSPQEQDEKVNRVLEMLKDIGKESRPRTLLRSLLTLHLEANTVDAMER